LVVQLGPKAPVAMVKSGGDSGAFSAPPM